MRNVSRADQTSTDGARRLRYDDVRPYAAPDDLAELDGPVAGEVELPRTLAWGPKRRFRLNDPRDRQRLYQTVIREASTSGELARYLNRTLVERMWSTLVLPAPCRELWERKFPELTHPATG